MIPTPNLDHITSNDYNYVYEPAEDTFLFLDALENEQNFLRSILKPCICLEIGSGSGCISTFLGMLIDKNTSLLLCTDINPYATSITVKTGHQNLIQLDAITTNLTSGLLPRLKHSIDLLCFNPPYVVTDSEELNSNNNNILDKSWAGGINGREVIDQMLILVDHNIKSKPKPKPHPLILDPRSNVNEPINNSFPNFFIPISPSVRKAISPDMRQSWILNSPITNSEAEETLIQPTPILENKMPTAKSERLIDISLSSSLPSTINEISGSDPQLLDNYNLTLSPTLTGSSRPVSSVSSATNVDNEYDALSDSSHSLSSSFSASILTSHRDSLCDTASSLSASPCQSEFNYKNHKRKSLDFHNPSQQHINNNTNLPDHHHRFSVPTVTNESVSNNPTNRYYPTSRRASMPIIHNNDSSTISTLSKFQFNEKISRASIRMSINDIMQKRLHIALEILTTERHYVECLLLVQKLFLNPLLKSLSTLNPILSKKTINKIFANMLDLISVNSELLKRLEERVFGSLEGNTDDDEFWNPEDGCLGDIFLNMAPFFKMYSIYVKNFNSALAVIDAELRDNPNFTAFLRDVIKTGQCKGLTLQAYLIMPVQRIPRYKLLLEDLLKKTPDSHSDYLNLKKAYHVIENVATFVNETIRQHEMFIAMLEIQRFLTGFDEAVLIPDAMKNGFQIITPQKSFTIYSDTPEEKTSWINAIRNTKEEFLSAKRTLKIDSNFDSERKDIYKKRIVENYHAPIWVPDSEADKCMNCSDEFTLFRRKHHCRACGIVNFVIPGSSEREDQWARACDPCFFTMFPDALRDEDLAPGIHVWNLTGSNRSSSSGHGKEISIGNDNDNKISRRDVSGRSGILTSQIKSIHEAIVARRCELCMIDFNIFRWRNVCIKCKKIDCLTKKPIDLSSIPKDFLTILMEDPQLQQQQNRFSNRFSTANIIRLCDFCYLDIDPNSVSVNEESGGGWAVQGNISPPPSP
ncbi:7867_t:CDS:10 [Entrophospora sp. SA101]|nr:7867_t:CDS:10 [Entrophospora sp. SA101]CAJ0908986.1 15519_t:CDS:10 [Entrophospora sp. SA101]